MIKVVQKCDRCGQEREITNISRPTLESDGWRVVPVDGNFGPAREEQPMLCRECVKAVHDFIKGRQRPTIVNHQCETRYDGNTMHKVHMALVDWHHDADYDDCDAAARDIITALQNAGILFRERI